MAGKAKKANINFNPFSFSGPPDPVGGCQIKNKTFTTISIGCRPGYNGGLKQYFVAILCPYNSFSSKIFTFLQILICMYILSSFLIHFAIPETIVV